MPRPSDAEWAAKTLRLEIIRDEIRRRGFVTSMASEFRPRAIAGELRTDEQLRAEVRYWLAQVTDTSGT